MLNEIARDRFAQANGWKYTRRGFTLDALMRNLYSGGESDHRASVALAEQHGRRHGYGTPWPFDHRESFRADAPYGRPVAILAHNYPDWDTDRMRELIADLGGKLVLHVPPAGMAASWYSPGATLPMCVTRPGYSVVWPTAAEMASIAEAFQRARPARGLCVPPDLLADLM